MESVLHKYKSIKATAHDMMEVLWRLTCVQIISTVFAFFTTACYYASSLCNPTAAASVYPEYI